MAILRENPVDWRRHTAIRKAWQLELRRRGLSSEIRISGIASEKARRGVMPPGVR